MRMLRKFTLGAALLVGAGLAEFATTTRSLATEDPSNTEAVTAAEEIFSSGPEYRKSNRLRGRLLLPPSMRSDDRVPCQAALQNVLFDDFGISLKEISYRKFSEEFRTIFENSFCKREKIVEFMKKKGAYISHIEGPNWPAKIRKYENRYIFYYDPGLFSSPMFWRPDYRAFLGFDVNDELIMAVWWLNK